MRIIEEALEVCVLTVGIAEADHAFLNSIFYETNWNLLRAEDRTEAGECLRAHAVHVVISDRDVIEGGWPELLRDLDGLAPAPALVVASRLADEGLWAEVLNQGGWDVLAQPFDPEEVRRVIAAAHRRISNASKLQAGGTRGAHAGVWGTA